jgi:hypothetical protein
LEIRGNFDRDKAMTFAAEVIVPGEIRIDALLKRFPKDGLDIEHRQL